MKRRSKTTHWKITVHIIFYNPVTGQIAPTEVNVADSSEIGENLQSKYIASLPNGFYNIISSPIKTIDNLKKKVKGDKVMPVIDHDIFFRLLKIGQKRQMVSGHLFTYKLCVVPPSLINDHGCLHKANKSGLAERPGVLEISTTSPDIVISRMIIATPYIKCWGGG